LHPFVSNEHYILAMRLIRIAKDIDESPEILRPLKRDPEMTRLLASVVIEDFDL
jgi:hypothetical protein